MIFPELALTGTIEEDIRNTSKEDIMDALNKIRNQADASDIFVVVGAPFMIENSRRNAAFVYNDSGVLVRV